MRTLAAIILAAAAAVPASALQHTVVPGDHLWGLAGHYYKNNFRWQVIYAANREKIKDPHWIYPGQVFEIPEVPNAAIGELPARPVEAEAVVSAPPPEEAAAAPVAAAPKPAPKAEPEEVIQDISQEIPEGQTPGYPSVRRVTETKGWKEDGKVTNFDGGREALAGVGDWIIGKIKSAREGDLFTVYRRTSRGTLDSDGDKTYLVVIGEVQAKASLPKGKWRFLVTKSGDTVQPGDLLKLAGSAAQ